MNALRRCCTQFHCFRSSSTSSFEIHTRAQDINWPPVSKLHGILQGCAKQREIRQGRACHGQILQLGLIMDILTMNMLINMYTKCGVLDCARKVFDEMPERSVVSWNTMIGSYTQNGDEEEALDLFVQMLRTGTQFTEFTVSGVLCACSAKFALLECKQLHAFALKASLDSNSYVANGLLNVYAKCNLIKDATKVFEEMPDKCATAWSSMVAGFVRNELHEEALELFHRAQTSGLENNQFVISSVLAACAAMAALIEGNQVHSVLIRTGIHSNFYVASSLVDMYAKCGSIKDAYAVFSGAEEKNIVLWNAMISGFSRHARSMEAMILFEKMQQMGLNPNEATYVSLLSVCGHKGLVDKGRKYFAMMKEKNVLPNVYHYSCMVDILGRTGLISEAKKLIDEMPFDSTPSMWGSLLSSCRVHKNVELAEICAKKLFKIEPNNAGNHVLLSNIYAASKQWEEVAKTRKILKDSVAKKEIGKSWIEIKGKVHIFLVGERIHHEIDSIYSKLENLMDDMKKAGYTGENEHDLHDVEEHRKQELLRHHSEKLAFVYGLMCLPCSAPIRIMKNLRICGDCHIFMKVASSITGREIIVRDNNRFHHFKDGFCSCGEFW